MRTSELVTAHHLARKALIYIRQSSPHQVLTNQESLRLQDALKHRAQSLGWRPEDIDIIDADWGLSASAAQQRAGFKEVVAKVTLGQVGILLSSEVTRRSRNCSDGYPWRDICGYKGCLIADCDGIDDPATVNGRVLLGLKGQLSALALPTLRARLTAGLLQKAQRGDLAVHLPVGLGRDAQGTVEKDPAREVHHRLELLFTTFLQLKSASKVLRLFNDHALDIPRRDRYGALVWKKPTVAAIRSTLKNPAYAGAFVYGRTRTMRTGASPVERPQKALPMDAWNIRVPHKYPAYIGWETCATIQAMRKDNDAEDDRHNTRGIPRPGAALVHGLVYCGACGHQMVVPYKGATRDSCNDLRQQYGGPVCQYIPADAVDARVVEAFFQALSPVELDLYARAMAVQHETAEKIARAHAQPVERLRYQAALAQRPFNRVDPDTRLVAAALERRWEAALRELTQAEAAAVQHRQQPAVPLALTAEWKAACTAIGQQLPQLWQQQRFSPPQKKALLRWLMEKVVIQRATRDQVHTRLVWKGGDTTTCEIPIAVGALAELSSANAMAPLILTLSAAGTSDQAMAQQ